MICFAEIYRYKDIQKYKDRNTVLRLQKWYNANVFVSFVCCCCCCCCCLTPQKEICKRCNLRKCINSDRFLAVLWEHVISNAKRVEVRKMSEFFFFLTKLHYKMSNLFWLWDFLLEDLKKNSDDVHWHVWTNIKKLYIRINIFKKKNSKDEILNHLYFGPNFVFWGTALGCFS